MPTEDLAFVQALHDSSGALQSVLQAVLEVERRMEPAMTALAFLNEITTSPRWMWLRPLYGLIADIDHALAAADGLPASEIAAIGAHAKSLLTGSGVPVEQQFLEHYRALLQADPEVAIAHAQALQTLRKLPPESDSESARLHARHQWNERRTHLRTRKR
ncbi:MAG: hypothetical protein ACHQAR_00555 [Steroidobacterales bacterium]